MSPEPSMVAADPAMPEPDRCERIAEMVKNIELPETRRRFLSPALQALQGTEPAGEAVARTLLHVGTTWRAHVQKVRGLTNIGRLLARRSNGCPFDPHLEEVLVRWGAVDLAPFRQAFARAVDTGIFPDRLAVAILPAEAACLRERTRHLADTADPYSMRAMARLLPLLRIHDELADRLDTLHRESESGVSQSPDLGLLRFLGDKEFARLEQVVREVSGMADLPEVWALQRRFQFDPPVLSALFTLSRTLGLPRPDAGWLERAAFWLRSALPGGAWQVRCAVPAGLVAPLGRAGVAATTGGIALRAQDLVLPSLLDEHTSSVDMSGGRKPPPPDWKGLVLSNITRDTLVAGFLANPKCVRVPGLVECVVVNSRSLQILSTIAQKRDLHTGHQNKGVPAALLRSRCKIPLTLLRRFVHIRFVSRAELKDIALRAPRSEVAKEVEDYLKTL